jgi:hypothetical protein
MKFISSETGQSLQLIVMDEVRPLRGGPFLPDAAAAISRRYRFVTVPAQTNPGQPIKFQTGAAELNGITIPITSLEIYSDGIIINSLTTDDADAVMDDFLSWSIQEFHYRAPTTQLPRQYQSTIVVGLERSLTTFISHFEEIREILVRFFKAEEDTLNVLRLSIGPHPPGALPYRTTWSIEPRTAQPIVANRYFSAAPLSTASHIELLSALEAAAADVSVS